MDTQSLKAFQAVAETGSFSDAAEQLHLTQPAVSKRIASLEHQLSCRLFDRIGRQVSLTEAGRALLPRARNILLEVADAQRLISDLSGEVRGKLSLATSHHIGLHRLPPVLKRFTKTYPGVELDLDFLDSEKAYEEIAHGNYDLAIVTLSPESTIDAIADVAIKGQDTKAPARCADSKTCSHIVWPDMLSFVAAPDHPLSQHKRLTLQSLGHFPAILPDINTYTTQLIKKLFDQREVRLEVTMATNHLDTIKMMVSIGLGWALLPDTIIDDQLKRLEVTNVHVKRNLGCIYHRERSLSNAARAFLNLLIPTSPQHQ